MRIAFVALALAALAGCETPPLTLDCETLTGEVSGVITTGAPAEPVAADLTVRGTVSTTDGRLIRRVRVAGLSAENDDFNFEAWSVVVPIGVLAGLPRTGTDQVALTATAIDGCDGEHAAGTLTVTLAPAEGAAP